MRKADIIAEIKELERELNSEPDVFIKEFNEKQESRNDSYRLDYKSFYPFIVGYVGNGLKHLVAEIDGGDKL